MELGLLPSWAGVRSYPGRGSATFWWPGVIDQAVEIDRLLRRRHSARDAVLCLVADGFDIDDEAARRMYLLFLRAIRNEGLLVPRPGSSKRAPARLRRRSLRGLRWWLETSTIERGIEALSAEARRNRDLDLPGRTFRSDVLTDQIEGVDRIVRGTLAGWARRDDFLHAAIEAPPDDVLEELHQRLGFTALRSMIATADTVAFQAAAIGLGRIFLGTADAVRARAEADGFDLFGDLDQTRAWHGLYREILLADPIVPVRLAPFFVSICRDEKLDAYVGSIFTEAALRFPDWRAMLVTVITWPTLAWGNWRAGRT